MTEAEKKRARERDYYHKNIDKLRVYKAEQQRERRKSDAYREWNREHKRLKRRTDPLTREQESARSKRKNLRRFGITQAEYAEMLAAQGSLCAICKMPERVIGRRLAVDHCHESGRIRGLLCHNCNVSLGLLKDDESVLRSAIEYLERSRAAIAAEKEPS